MRIVVLCDGTWCGPETGTRTNIAILAEKMGIDMNSQDREVNDPSRNLKAKYFDGIGLGSTFFAYLFNGSTANDISEMCLETYKFIARTFEENAEIWMFGLSRGAYTVRCVAGMINNCGIVKEASDDLCKQVYRIYSSPYDEDRPDSRQSTIFREEASWSDPVPIKFMGLFDTVGSIGIPSLDAGNGPMYPTLWDQIVPSVVDKVYHACSLHDRLSVFQPCLTKLSDKETKVRPPPQITEKWFPGCHYDLGRQRFKFLRQHAPGIEYWLSLIPNALSGTLEPNNVLSDLVLKWMLEAIQNEYRTQTVIHKIDVELRNLDHSIKTVKNGVGSGDIYEKGLPYIPFGSVITLILPAFVKKDLNSALEVLLAVRDRRIPDDKAVIYPYQEPYARGSPSIFQLGNVTEERYPSRTYQSFEAWVQYFISSHSRTGHVNGLR
jgi:hypothetical protein